MSNGRARVHLIDKMKLFAVTLGERFRAIKILVKIGFIGLVQANQCTSKGGTCTDWRYTTCNAGYQRNICPGDGNQRCCLYCSPTCEANEDFYQQYDGHCTAQGGQCKDDTNYCNGTWQSGVCGGGNNRRCCVKGSLVFYDFIYFI